MAFSDYRDNFDPETLAILEAAFNEAWEVLMASGGDFDQEATRNALADFNHELRGRGRNKPEEIKGTRIVSAASNSRSAIGKAPTAADALGTGCLH
jgi:hypothetical protein